MTTPAHPTHGDEALLEAFAAAVTSLHALNGMPARTEEDEKRLAAACTVHDQHRMDVYLTPPATLAGALAKMLMLAEPELGLDAGTRGLRGGPDLVCVNQVAAFLATLPGVVQALPSIAVATGGVRLDALTLALAEARRRAEGDFRNRRWQPQAVAVVV